MSGPVIRLHGGGCCGIYHIYDMTPFSDERKKKFDKIIKEWTALKYDKKARMSVLLEVVITDYQIKGWPSLLKYMKKYGFKRVNAFRNRNSGNICYVYHKRLLPNKS